MNLYVHATLYYSCFHVTNYNAHNSIHVHAHVCSVRGDAEAEELSQFEDILSEFHTPSARYINLQLK